jgi:hypothetical protein
MVEAVCIAADEISKPMLKLFAGQRAGVIGYARSCCQESSKIGLLAYYILLSRSEKSGQFPALARWRRLARSPAGSAAASMNWRRLASEACLLTVVRKVMFEPDLGSLPTGE